VRLPLLLQHRHICWMSLALTPGRAKVKKWLFKQSLPLGEQQHA
jgi:hypothetical protein